MSIEDNQEFESTISNEEENLETQIEDTDDVEALKAEIERERTAKQQILARAKKAEAEAKELKSKATSQDQNLNNNTLTADDIDARVLRAQGMEEEMLEKLKKVAQVTGKTLIEAQSDEIFVAFKEKRENEKKAEQARLGASSGSRTQKKEKDINTPGLSDEEHKQKWREAMGK